MWIKIKLKSIVVALLLGISSLNAQEAIITSGGNADGNGGSSSYTVGNFAYRIYSSTNGSITEGVQQPYEISTILGGDVTKIALSVKAFPNPTINNLTLSITGKSKQKLSYRLFNVQAQLLQTNQLVGENAIINMQYLASGVYMLNVYAENRLLKIFKIIKN